jgi:anti-sigma regulatory factor (Ser/Thr protein kinase)
MSVSSQNRPELTEWACVHLDRDLAQAGPAADFLRSWLQARGAPEGQATDEIVLAAMEALTNAMRHGGGGERDFTVRMAWCWRDGTLELEVTEPGRFEPSPAWADLPADPLAEGGRGGFLITKLMDAVEHRNAGGRHTLRMRRSLGEGRSGNSVTPAPAAKTANEAGPERGES